MPATFCGVRLISTGLTSALTAETLLLPSRSTTFPSVRISIIPFAEPPDSPLNILLGTSPSFGLDSNTFEIPDFLL
ncbi:unknown [Clostridium sp. CAG:813]|nr:unknown [Clostridium sp. CAG:813]